MELLVFILILLGAIFAFLYLCKKEGFDIVPLLTVLFGRGHDVPVEATGQNQSLARCVNAEYEAFSLLVWRCINAVYRICDIECPDSSCGIWCSRTPDRVKVINGHWSFMYEVPLVNTGAIRNGRFSTKSADVQHLAEILSENLPDYMDGGFYFEGKVYVWPIDQNRVRIEVQGIGRNFYSSEDIMI